MDTPIDECELNVALRKAVDEGTPDRIVQELTRIADRPELLVDDVSPARVLVVACEVLERCGRYDEAIETARRAADTGTSDGDELDPAVWLARILVVAGRTREGLEEFRRVRRRTPDDFVIYLIASEAFEQAGDPRQAIAWLTSGAQRAQRAEDRGRGRGRMLLAQRRRVRQAQGFPEDGADDSQGRLVRPPLSTGRAVTRTEVTRVTPR